MAEMLPVFIIMALVMIVLPIGLGRLSGKSPMEVFFGSRVKDSAFGAGETKGTDGEKKAKSGGKQEVQAGSTRQELMECISMLLSYARRNRFYCMVPGTVTADGETASLAAVIVTRSAVLGFNCFGYGGKIFASRTDGPWLQNAGDGEKEIDSPTVRNRKQKEILDKALASCGLEGLETRVFGVFTAGSAKLKNSGGTGCVTVRELQEVLGSDRILKDGGVDPKETGARLEACRKKQ